MYALNYCTTRWTWKKHVKIHDIYYWINSATHFTSWKIEWIEDDEWFKCHTRIQQIHECIFEWKNAIDWKIVNLLDSSNDESDDIIEIDENDKKIKFSKRNDDADMIENKNEYKNEYKKKYEKKKKKKKKNDEIIVISD